MDSPLTAMGRDCIAISFFELLIIVVSVKVSYEHLGPLLYMSTPAGGLGTPAYVALPKQPNEYFLFSQSVVMRLKR